MAGTKSPWLKPVDLTLEISSRLPSFPGSPPPRFISWADKKSDGYNLEMLFLSSHTGTHLDAPYHFVQRGPKIDKIPLSRLITTAFLFKTRKGPDEKITRKDIAEFARAAGALPANSAVIFRTDWSRNVSRRDYFTRNPGLSAGAARHLAAMRPGLVGIDSPSIDPGGDSSFSSHHILLGKNILVLENLCNLDKIRKTPFGLIVMPLKLRGATGSPVRAVAV